MIVIDGKVLTNADARVILDNYLSSRFSLLAEKKNFVYGFSEDYGPGIGDIRAGLCDDGTEDIEFVKIGIFEQFLVDGPLCDEPADAYHFVTMLTAISHEYQHLSQYLLDHHTREFPGPQLYANSLAHSGNCKYYYANYSCNPREIDAQFRGVFEVYGFLKTIVSDEEANQLVCMYQNRRQAEFREQQKKDLAYQRELRDAGDPSWADVDIVPLDFIDRERDYTSVNEIFIAYKRAFLKSIRASRAYDFEHAQQDVAANIFAKYKVYRDAFRREKDGFQQDKMLASLNFTQDYQRDYILPAIQKETGLDLSIACVFRNTNRVQRIVSSVKTRNAAYDAESRFGNILEQLEQRDADDQYDE